MFTDTGEKNSDSAQAPDPPSAAEKSGPRKTGVGRVTLVGAGPGDPGLITVAGAQALGRAEVVIYDALANPQLLSLAPPAALLIDAGKRAREHRLTQDQTQALMLQHAQQGKYVVRLKGGDPYLFGRGAEELAYLASHGIACTVIPGITSGIAAPMYAGIPVTHRDHASTVTFVTGHEDPDKQATAVDYAALSALIQRGGTVCLYMGIARLPAIVQELMKHGLSAQTPAAAVQWGTRLIQKSVRGQLHDLPEKIQQAQLAAPAIVVIGAVAGMQEAGLDFFTKRPLFGQRVLVTRTRQQASELRELLEQAGAQVIEAPTIELAPITAHEQSQVDAAIRGLSLPAYDWIILTSVNAVQALREHVDALELDARQFARVKMAVIGESTRDALREQLGLRADLLPGRAVAESLAGELLAKLMVQSSSAPVGLRVLLLRADIARPALPQLLAQAGVIVTDLPLYHTCQPAGLPQEVMSALREKQIDWITFTSSSTAKNLVELLGNQRSLLSACKLASIGPITSQTMRELNLPITVEAQDANVASLVETMVQQIRCTACP